MSENLINNGHRVELKAPHGTRTLAERTDQPEPGDLWVSATDDAELRFIVRSVMWMMLFAVVPLILLYVACYFYPELLHVPATSR